MTRRKHAFTLVELLVVIAIIGILAGLLLPAVFGSIARARDGSCKSQLRQFAMATRMYVSENSGIMPDSYGWMNYKNGLPRYMSANMTRFSRCPGDQVTNSMNRLGTFNAKRSDGTAYSLQVSYGGNENCLSASARPTSAGPQAFWVVEGSIPGVPSKTMVWADWQNNPYAAAPTCAVVKPGSATTMGSLCFRHRGHCNAVYLDGHVGTMTPTIATRNDGHDMAAGATWGSAGGGAAYKTYYPFAPGQTPSGWTVTGDFPTISFQ